MRMASENRRGVNMNTISSLKIGEKAMVKKLNCNGALRRHIMDMGLTKGVNVELIKYAPMGDPIEIRIRGYELSIRKSEACLIEVEK